MHANDGSGLDRVGSLNLFEMNHRDASVGIAFCARLNTGIASNASTWVDVELALAHYP